MTLCEARPSAETVVYPEFGDTRIADLTPRHLDGGTARVEGHQGGRERAVVVAEAGTALLEGRPCNRSSATPRAAPAR